MVAQHGAGLVFIVLGLVFAAQEWAARRQGRGASVGRLAAAVSLVTVGYVALLH